METSTIAYAQPKPHPPDAIDMLLVSKAGFWIRAIAYSLDQILIGTLVLVLSVAAIITLGYAGALIEGQNMYGLFSSNSLMYGVAIFYIGFLIDGIYFTFFHGYSGQTVGKMIMGLRVVKTDGSPLGYATAFKRWLGYFASSFILGIGYLMIAFTRDKQALHDKIADTYVIRL